MAVAALLLAGCGSGDPAPPSLGVSTSPELLFLVKNELWTIRIDGTRRESRGTVGDDRHRTGWPRLMPDQRIALLADETGGIFPYVGPHEGGYFTRLAETNVTLHDSLCGVNIGGESRMVLTTTPFVPTHGTLFRIDLDDPRMEAVDHESMGVILNPAPYDDGRVLAVRVTDGQTHIELIDVSGPAFQVASSEVLATLFPPFLAQQPARLPDGRVLFIRYNPDGVSDSDIGELFVIDTNHAMYSTGVTGVLGLEAVGNGVVYEAAGGGEFTDLVYTDLMHAPVNVTNTPYLSEHIGWSD